MINTSKLLAVILCVLLISVPVRGRKISKTEKKCLKKFPVLAYDPYQELCFQKCLWHHNGLIRNKRLAVNSLKFINDFNDLFGNKMKKTAKFQQCLAKRLPSLKINDCFDMMKIKSCFMDANKNKASPRIILLTTLYGINSIVGSILQPIEEGIVNWLYGSTKNNDQDLDQE